VSSAAPDEPVGQQPIAVEVSASDWMAFVEALAPAGFVLEARPGGGGFLCRRAGAPVTSSLAGVAHEVSNPLTAVLANLELALQTLAVASAEKPTWLPALRAELEDAHTAADHLNQLLRAVKGVGRGESVEPQAVDVAEVIEVALRMAGNEVKSRARLVRQMGEMPLVLGTALRLGQVFLNLLLNAAQAIEPGRPEAHEVRVVTARNDQGWAVIAISDTGVGIPPSDLGRVSTPFFSTKPPGLGSGLGLPISHRIVEALGGRIELVSQEGVGTTVTVYLPPAPRR
jgi:two-component system NtrC family sensor kinase